MSEAAPCGGVGTGGRVLVEMAVADFRFVIAVAVARAPISSAYFLDDVDAERLRDASLFRIVNLQNQAADHPSPIEVVQMGLLEKDARIAPSIVHETTGRSGLRHLKGTVSLARFAPGAVYHSWFVCMRDEPALDEGGSRHPDGLGFAAFGHVVEGLERLVRLYDEYGGGPEWVDRPLALRNIRRVG
jgi:peptidyl-prolyl cis-trans isomerase A (cyclophilin A)